MSGILGWIGLKNDFPARLPLELLRHRGPNDQGQVKYLSQTGRVTAVLGSTRLSIIDLSPAGHMPMEYPGEPLAIVFNGEVYNFQELRREMEQLGERFFSRTDTEVILRGYRLWGDRVIERLRGMFAFAIWDGRSDGRLLIVRDRFGKKPLYLKGDDQNGLWFASELKAILDGKTSRDIDPVSLEYYLDRGYPPSDRCLLRGYRKLLPGHVLVWERGESRERKYWDISEASESFLFDQKKHTAREMRTMLAAAVEDRLVSDVPLGLLLSGGVDSNSILALMTQLTPEPVRTYTACFGASNLDESEKARQSAHLMSSRHHAIIINPRAGRLLPFIASQLDEPIADSSAIATYLICRRAREEVTVLLTGDGSDELLLGYPRYRMHAASQVLSRILPGALRKAASQLLPSWSILERTISAPEDPLLRDRYWLDHGRRRVGAFTRSKQRFSKEEAVLKVLQEDIKTWLVEDILVKLDKMSMAASVEIRVPFLDQKLAEWIISLPISRRMTWWRGKQILFEAMRSLVPQHISWSRKQPFHLPINDWLRSEWRLLLQDVLLDPRTEQRGWLDIGNVRRLVKEHLAGQGSHGWRLYQLLILELWARSILDRGKAEPIPGSVDDCARELIPDRPIRKLSILAPAGIGDTMRLSPGLKYLGDSDPNVSVTLYVDQGRGSDEPLAGLPPVDRQVPIDFRGKGCRNKMRLLRDIRKTFPNQLVSTWISRLSGSIGLLSGVRQRSGWVPQWSFSMRLNKFCWKKPLPYNPTQKNVGIHDTQAFGQLLGGNPLPTCAPIFAPPIWEESALVRARRELKKLNRPVLVVNAVAQQSIRQREYPLKQMALVISGLLEKGIVNSFVLLGDAYSQMFYESLSKVIGARGLNLSGELSLTASAAIIKESDAMLTIDGGLLHVALASDIPVIALYGPTEIYSEDPRGDRGRYVVLSAFNECHCFCLNHRGIQAGEQCLNESHCLASIPPDRVVDAVSSMLTGIFPHINGGGRLAPRWRQPLD